MPRTSPAPIDTPTKRVGYSFAGPTGEALGLEVTFYSSGAWPLISYNTDLEPFFGDTLIQTEEDLEPAVREILSNLEAARK